MNNYSKHIISRFYERYIGKKFDQDDVALFIILARDYCPKNYIFRELGDFLAHPDNKDRGIVISSILPVVDFFEKETLNVMSGDRVNVEYRKVLGVLEEAQKS